MHQPTARPAAAAQPLVWSRIYPGRPEQAREVRRFLAAILAGCQATDDAVLCLSELAANALNHSNSRMPGGQFTIDVNLYRGRLRVAVHDDGGPWIEPAESNGQHGRGLIIVGQLACDWGRTGSRETGWTVWFEMDCP